MSVLESIYHTANIFSNIITSIQFDATNVYSYLNFLCELFNNEIYEINFSIFNELLLGSFGD